MRKILALSSLALLLASCSQEHKPQAKYIFYFISDGTGVNTVLGTEQMLAEIKGYWGRDSLCMTNFPVVGVSSTYSFNSGITDSAASGTCLATSTKTYNGAIGVDADTIPIYGIAYWAKAHGVPVGIATNVSVNHATPAAQYAHSVSRHLYYDIAKQVPSTGFDFFGGSDFQLDRPYRTPEYREELYQSCRDSGYVIVRGLDDYYQKVGEGADRVIMFQHLDRTLNVTDAELPYNIDAQPGEVTVHDILKAQIDFLYRRSEALGGKGFYLMNEIGGSVDHACHAQDAATAFREVQLVDSCVRLAYDFYLQHPDETLIVVTSDHETGGLTLGRNEGGYVANFGLLANQTCSIDQITHHLQQLRTDTRNHVVWPQVKEVLTQDLGFWQGVEISPEEEREIMNIFTKSFVGKMPTEKNLYSENEPLAGHCIRLLNLKAHIGWTSGGHTAGLVPVYACGVGAERFSKHNDNSTIAKTIAEIAGWDH